MKLMKTAALTAMTMLAVGATAGPSSAQDKDLKVGAIYMDAQGFYAGVRKGIQTGAADAGRKLDIIETNAQGDVSKESSFIRFADLGRRPGDHRFARVCRWVLPRHSACP